MNGDSGRLLLALLVQMAVAACGLSQDWQPLNGDWDYYLEFNGIDRTVSYVDGSAGIE